MINVARYHLVQPVLSVTLPLAMLAFLFALNAARGGDTWRDGLAVIFLPGSPSRSRAPGPASAGPTPA